MGASQSRRARAIATLSATLCSPGAAMRLSPLPHYRTIGALQFRTLKRHHAVMSKVTNPTDVISGAGSSSNSFGITSEDVATAPPAPADPDVRKISLYSLSDEDLAAMLAGWGEKKFRLKQIRDFIYGDNPVTDIADMHTLPKALRAKLLEHVQLGLHPPQALIRGRLRPR